MQCSQSELLWHACNSLISQARVKFQIRCNFQNRVFWSWVCDVWEKFTAAGGVKVPPLLLIPPWSYSQGGIERTGGTSDIFYADQLSHLPLSPTWNTIKTQHTNIAISSIVEVKSSSSDWIFARFVFLFSRNLVALAGNVSIRALIPCCHQFCMAILLLFTNLMAIMRLIEISVEGKLVTQCLHSLRIFGSWWSSMDSKN